MGYSKGQRWTDDLIKEKIVEVVNTLKLDSFPTHSQMDAYYGNKGLTCKISKSGGTKHWADKLNLPIKPCESKLGDDFELFCIETLTNLYGFECEKMKPRYPYDITVNKNIKIDVKCSNLFKSKHGNYFTFNLEKSNPTCDIYICYCLSPSREVLKFYTIPSAILQGKCQLSVGEINSKYDKYKNNYKAVKYYDGFYSLIAS